MSLPDSFLVHLAVNGYHSRSDKHSKALCEAIVADLVKTCPVIASEASAGQLVFQHNHDLIFGHTTWNTDLAIGLPPSDGKQLVIEPKVGMARATPTTVRIAVEAKSVMTEHRKAIKNRKRDFEAHHAHVHDHDRQAIAAGILLLNAADTFQSPLRPEPSTHRQPQALIRHCINEMNSVTASSGSSSVGLDARCVLTVAMDNIVWPTTRWFTDPPAPKPGSPLYWDAFIQRICQTYQQRFT